MAQRLGDRVAGAAAHLAVRLAEQRQGLLEGQRPPVEIDPDPGAQLLEQARPGGVSNWAVVRQDPLLRLTALLRAELARPLDRLAVPRRHAGRAQPRRAL